MEHRDHFPNRFAKDPLPALKPRGDLVECPQQHISGVTSGRFVAASERQDRLRKKLNMYPASLGNLATKKIVPKPRFRQSLLVLPASKKSIGVQPPGHAEAITVC